MFRKKPLKLSSLIRIGPIKKLIILSWFFHFWLYILKSLYIYRVYWWNQIPKTVCANSHHRHRLPHYPQAYKPHLLFFLPPTPSSFSCLLSFSSAPVSGRFFSCSPPLLLTSLSRLGRYFSKTSRLLPAFLS